MTRDIFKYTNNRNYILILLSILLSACSHQQSPAPAKVEVRETSTNQTTPYALKDKLLNHFQSWKGTPYRYGGLSKKGIDCSGFVYLTYKNQLNHQLPRTTWKQASIGQQIDSRNIAVGDLMFFNTGKKFRHVGIYVGDQKFMHASTSSGVIISSLNNRYWRDAFWMVRRIELDN